MWGNEVLLLLLEKTLRFETIAEISCKNLRYGILLVILQKLSFNSTVTYASDVIQ